jgi:hypothetical protein
MTALIAAAVVVVGIVVSRRHSARKEDVQV